MDLFPAILRAFEKTSFRTVNTGKEKPRSEGRCLIIPPALLEKAAEEGFRELSFFLRESQLALLARRLVGNDASENDRFVIRSLLRNAVVSSKGELALCQDTGTAVICGWKDEGILSGRDRDALETGIAAAYKNNFLRSSLVSPSSFFGEFNTGDNLPAQIRIEAVTAGIRGPAYRFLFSARGGGSSNMTGFFSMTGALLEENAFDAFLREKITALGTSACPPYRLAVVVGGTSPELNLEALKLAVAEALDQVPCFSGEPRQAVLGETAIWRDRYWEERAMEIGRQSGLGAQFGGTSLLLDARVLRLPRHAASCPVSIGVSCAAHRNILALIDSEGLHIERLVRDPETLLRNTGVDLSAENWAGSAYCLNLEKPVREICRELSGLRAGARLLVSGKLLVARDAAHRKWHALLAEGGKLPDYLFEYPIYYAGPSATPPGRIIGSLGPTTAGRMDPYGEELLSRGASLITLAKGNRFENWKKLCAVYGGYYLGTLGGSAALMSQENVSGCEILDYPELGMEAVRLVTVKNLPAFMVISSQATGR